MLIKVWLIVVGLVFIHFSRLLAVAGNPVFSLFCIESIIMSTWMCLICGWIYDEEAGLPEEGIAPGTKWADVPPNWVCPECGARKEDFEMIEV